MGMSSVSNLPIEDIPEQFVEIVAKIKLQQRDVRKTMLKIIHNCFQNDVDSDRTIMEICEYMCFLSKDCYRTFFIYLIGTNVDIDNKELNLISAVLEMINCCVMNKFALPDIENNDFIDKQVSCHKKFGNGNTMMAIDAMESLALQTIYSNNNFFNEKQKCRLIEIINNYLGKDGVCGGQVMKMLCKKKKVYKDELTRIQQMTFNAYFIACIDCLNVILCYTQRQKNILRSYANNVCNLLCMLKPEKGFSKNTITENSLQKAKLFVEQGDKMVKNVKNQKLMQNFIEYIYYNIERKRNCSHDNSPTIVKSDVATL